MDKKIVITIARQYGSGGKTIGEMLAKELGVEFYNRDIVRLASEDSGIKEELFVQVDEKLKKKSLFRLSSSVYDGKLIPPESTEFVSDKNLFNYQAKIIKELAEMESCVIVGRCADYVLKDYDNVVSVFIYADKEFCFDRAKERNSMSDKDLEKYIAQIDKHRGDFYKHYTGHEWSDARNYDLCLNSGKLGFEKCMEEIISYCKIRFGE